MCFSFLVFSFHIFFLFVFSTVSHPSSPVVTHKVFHLLLTPLSELTDFAHSAVAKRLHRRVEEMALKPWTSSGPPLIQYVNKHFGCFYNLVVCIGNLYSWILTKPSVLENHFSKKIRMTFQVKSGLLHKHGKYHGKF